MPKAKTKKITKKKTPEPYFWTGNDTFSETFSTAFRKGSDTTYSTLGFHIIHTINGPFYSRFVEFGEEFLDRLHRSWYTAQDFKKMFLMFKEERDRYANKLYMNEVKIGKIGYDEYNKLIEEQYGDKSKFLIFSCMLACMDNETLEDMAAWFTYCVEVMSE